MKNRLVAILFLLLGAMSCVKEEPICKPQPLKDHVTLEFAVAGQPATKGVLGETDDIQDIHVAIFGTSGYLQEYSLATIKETNRQHTVTVIENGVERPVTVTEYSYSVPLPLYDGKCTLHFIANGPATIPFGNEATVMSSLITSRGSGREDGYWQCRVLENGIMYDEAVFNATGTIQLPATFAADNDLAHIPLVRNFAKLTVNVDRVHCPNFELLGFAVINEPMAGSIAPYNSITSEYIQDYESYGYHDLKAQYPGYMPSSVALDTSIPEGGADYLSEGEYSYIYERPSSIRNPLHLIMKGNYTDENNVQHNNRYYKINILDGGAVAAFLRNMEYNILITGVAQIGSATAATAETIISSVDITSEIFQELPSYQEGASSIYVEYTSMTHVQGGTYTVKFRYVSNGENHNDVVAVTTKPGSILSDVSITSRDDGSDTDGLGGWGTITYTVADPGALQQDQTITVSGGTMSRDIKISLMGPQTLTLSLDPDAILEKVGEQTTLTIGLPVGLPVSMFPLNLKIESDRLSLSPVSGEQLPVTTVPSIVPSKNGANSFIYIKTLDRASYLNLVAKAEAAGEDKVYVSGRFQSNIERSACNIYVDNDYFNKEFVTLENYAPGHFTNLKYENNALSGQFNVIGGKILNGEDKQVVFSFTMDKNAARDVSVVLTGLAPDPSVAAELREGPEHDGKHFILIGSSAGTHALHLITTTEEEDVNVALSTYRFMPAELSAERTALHFTNPTFTTSGNLNIGIRQTQFGFSYTDGAIEDVTVTITGGSVDDSRFSLVSSAGGVNTYIFTPTSTATYQSFNITSEFAHSISVQLSANNYDDSDVISKSRQVYIAAQSLYYSSNMGTLSAAWSKSYPPHVETTTGSQRQWWIFGSYCNSQAMTIPITDDQNLTSGSKLYFMASSNSKWAEITLDQIVNNSTNDLTFN